MPSIFYHFNIFNLGFQEVFRNFNIYCVRFLMSFTIIFLLPE